jgi:hypothetical protein
MAGLDVDDLAAIVGELDSRQRERVLNLIAAYRGQSASSLPVLGETAESSGLSPWLATRVATAAGIDHALTSTAHAALKARVQEGASSTARSGQRRSSVEALLTRRGRP